MKRAWNAFRKALDGQDAPRPAKKANLELMGLEDRVVLSTIGVSGRHGASRIGRMAQVGRMSRSAAYAAKHAATTTTQTATAATAATDTATAAAAAATTDTSDADSSDSAPPDSGRGSGGGRGMMGGGNMNMGGGPQMGGGKMGGGPQMDDGDFNGAPPRQGDDSDSDSDSAITQDTQLKTDLDKLQTDTEAIGDASTVTDAQRLALTRDLRAIDKAGFDLDPSTLSPVTDKLVTAIADGSYGDGTTDTATAIKTSFQALFTDSSVDSTVVSKTYDDIVAITKNLNITSDKLATLTADQTAITADFTRLGIDTTSTDGPGPIGSASSTVDLILQGNFGRPQGPRF